MKKLPGLTKPMALVDEETPQACMIDIMQEHAYKKQMVAIYAGGKKASWATFPLPLP